jgi:membrane protease subunit (stomatin/prohibitin family)
MSLFHSENPKEEEHKGILGAFSVDNIKYEPEDDKEASLVVKRYPYEDFPNGSYLQVAPSQMAVFTNNLAAGDSLTADGRGASQVSVFIGPCKIKLDTGDSRFAPFRNVTHSLTGGTSAFHSTVYFVNTTYMNELRWGTTDPILVQDPEEEVNVHVRAYGLFGVHIEQVDEALAPIQARKFLMKVVGTRGDYSREQLTDFMRAKILEYVPDLLAKAITQENISVLKIAAHLSDFSSILQEKLIGYFDDFGLTLDNFSFHSIKPLEEDLAAINEMKIQRKRSILEAQGNAAKMDIESGALARKRQREGYTYQQERGMDVMQSAASNEGAGSAGLMGAGMGLGMGVGMGGAFGAGFANLAQETVQQVGSQAAGNPGTGTVKCRNCGHENPSTAKFCLECGAKLEQGIVCKSCGHLNPPGAKFCMECGTKLSGAKHCPNCGAELPEGTKFCPSCGTRIDQ